MDGAFVCSVSGFNRSTFMQQALETDMASCLDCIADCGWINLCDRFGNSFLEMSNPGMTCSVGCEKQTSLL